MNRRFKYPRKYYRALSGDLTYQVSVYKDDEFSPLVAQRAIELARKQKEAERRLNIAKIMQVATDNNSNNVQQQQVSTTDQIQQSNQDFTVPEESGSMVVPVAIGAAGMLAYLLMR